MLHLILVNSNVTDVTVLSNYVFYNCSAKVVESWMPQAGLNLTCGSISLWKTSCRHFRTRTNKHLRHIFAHVVMFKVQLLFNKHQLYFFVFGYRGIIAPWDLDIIKSPLIKLSKVYNPKALSALKAFCNELLVSRCRRTPSVLRWLLLNGDPWDRAVGWEQRRGHGAAREGRHRKMTDEKDIWVKKNTAERMRRIERKKLQGRVQRECRGVEWGKVVVLRGGCVLSWGSSVEPPRAL